MLNFFNKKTNLCYERKLITAYKGSKGELGTQLTWKDYLTLMGLPWYSLAKKLNQFTLKLGGPNT